MVNVAFFEKGIQTPILEDNDKKGHIAAGKKEVKVLTNK